MNALAYVDIWSGHCVIEVDDSCVIRVRTEVADDTFGVQIANHDVKVEMAVGYSSKYASNELRNLILFHLVVLSDIVV